MGQCLQKVLYAIDKGLRSNALMTLLLNNNVIEGHCYVVDKGKLILSMDVEELPAT